ncbi:type IV pili methyl-accepting chemotaxis transducer N-terminal domain-containing protein [Ramlibacter alkalitolerans]|uniref:Sensor protein n=1 Tax=Ramlibacter alkalitolerans TaxID=2039631 RepID=A0ABS1JQ86_9BURK|nr:type IV pili methyl-accepting chemotaxis transducer N-terminal domain-containing protein [Ramlibacter alkalitolerans]
MKLPPTLTARLVATGTGLLLLALVSISLTLWVTWNMQGGAAAVNEAGRMRMQTYRLALVLHTTGNGDEARALARGFEESLALLEGGDPSRPLFVPWSPPSRARFTAVRTRWQALRARWLDGTPDPDLVQESAGFVALVDGLVAAIEAQISRWTTVLQMFQLALVGLAITSAVLMFYSGYVFVLRPLAGLKKGLAAVQSGELRTRVEVDSGDEFGELAAGFNDMTRTLQSLYLDLEEKVREKTRRVEHERQRLADLYEVSAFVAEAPTLDALARGFAGHVRRIARADACAVRLRAEDPRRFVLVAHELLPDDLAAANACIESGACHCGEVTVQSQTRVIPIASAERPTLGYCVRAGFTTVVSVPVRIHERLLGEVNLFYRGPVDLSNEDRDLLDALASHFASALASQRAAALEREAAVAEERGLLARELHDSIAQALLFMKIQVGLLRQAAQRGDHAAAERGIAELETGVRDCYADVRELLLHFRTRTSEQDIEPALRTTLQKFEHQTGLPARLSMQGHGVPLAPDVQVQVLHILQEALSNVRKHARARHVELRVQPAPHWRFEVHDDGAGFDPQRPGADATRVGLRIMQERALRIGARVQVHSAPGAGCTLVLELPATGPAAMPAPAAQALA